MPNKLIIIGAGGVGREIAASLEHPELAGEYGHKAFVDDAMSPGEVVNGIPVLGDIDWLLEQKEKHTVLVAQGNVEMRKKVLERLKAGNFDYPTIVHPGAHIHSRHFNHIGRGSFIGDGSIITGNVRIGDFCFVNGPCSLHHDTVIGENTIVMPGVHITAPVEIGPDSYIGSGSILAKSEKLPSSTLMEAGTIRN